MTNQELVAFLKKNPIGVGCGVLSLALGVGSFLRTGGSLFGLDSPIDTIPAAEKVLEKKTSEARGYETNAKHSVHLKEQLEALLAANKAIAARLVRPAELATNNQYFYKIIGESGVKRLDVRQVGVSGETKGGPFVPVVYTVGVQGEFAEIIHFQQLLERGARYCRVLGATCSGPGANRTGTCTLNVTVELLGLP